MKVRKDIQSRATSGLEGNVIPFSHKVLDEKWDSWKLETTFGRVVYIFEQVKRRQPRRFRRYNNRLRSQHPERKSPPYRPREPRSRKRGVAEILGSPQILNWKADFQPHR